MSRPHRSVIRNVICSLLVGLNTPLATGTTIASVKVETLFHEADLVAIVRILSGDSENYPVTIYKAEVLKAFKGAAVKEKIYFGPFVSLGVGSEYLVFLSKSNNGIKVQGSSPLNYGAIPIFYRIMYDGYSIMPITYECVFDGKEMSQECDYGVNLNPEQVLLPKSVKMFPSGEAGPLTNYRKWVRKAVFVSLLDAMTKQNN
jgi:hypothetical protein